MAIFKIQNSIFPDMTQCHNQLQTSTFNMSFSKKHCTFWKFEVETSFWKIQVSFKLSYPILNWILQVQQTGFQVRGSHQKEAVAMVLPGCTALVRTSPPLSYVTSETTFNAYIEFCTLIHSAQGTTNLVTHLISGTVVSV